MAIYFPDGNGGRKIIAKTEFNLADLKLTGFSQVADATGELNDDDNMLSALAKIWNRRQVVEQLTTVRTPSQSSTLTYSGVQQQPTWNNYDANQLTIGGTTSATNAGTYSATFLPHEGYQWEDGTTTAKSVNWTIGRATISTVPSQSNTLFYDGTPKAPAWRNYDANQLTIGGTVQATDLGTYSATFTPKSNYKWADGTTTAKTVSWAIGSSVADAVPTASGTLRYTGTAQSPTWNNYDSTRLEISGTTSATAVGMYSATFTPKNGVVWADGSTSAKSVSWTIEKAILTAPTVTTTSMTYNGNNQAPVVGAYDANLITVTGNAPQVNAGSYTVVCALKDKANYQWSDGTTEEISTPWTIRKVTLEVPTVTDTDFEQDGNSHAPTISSYNATAITVTGNTPQTAVGTYTIVFALKDKTNYQWLDGSTEDKSVEWKIEAPPIVEPDYEEFYGGVNMLQYHTMRFGTDAFILPNT